MDVEDGGGENVLGAVGGADLAEEGLELGKGLDEEDAGAAELLVQFGGLRGDAGVDDGARVEA